MVKSMTERFNFCPSCGSRGLTATSDRSKRCKDCGFEFYMNVAAANVAVILDEHRRLLVVRRKHAPARGTLDLPGGFAEPDETAEESVCREVYEETGLTVCDARYLFSLPNTYVYSDLEIHTMDLFFGCRVTNASRLQAADDAECCLWLSPDDLHAEDFGLQSIAQGVKRIRALILNDEL